MSPTTRTDRRGRTRPARYRAVQWPMVLWLTLVWWVLWGSYSLLSLVGGVLVAVAACWVFPLPPLQVRFLARHVQGAHLLGADVLVLAKLVKAGASRADLGVGVKVRRWRRRWASR